MTANLSDYFFPDPVWWEEKSVCWAMWLREN